MLLYQHILLVSPGNAFQSTNQIFKPSLGINCCFCATKELLTFSARPTKWISQRTTEFSKAVGRAKCWEIHTAASDGLVLLPVCHARTPSNSAFRFLPRSTENVNPCTCHFTSRVTFSLYACKGYGVVRNDLSSFINVLFQTGSLKKQQMTLSLKPIEGTHRWVIIYHRSLFHWRHSHTSMRVWVMPLMRLRNGTKRSTGCLWTQADHSPRGLRTSWELQWSHSSVCNIYHDFHGGTTLQGCDWIQKTWLERKWLVLWNH